MSATPCIVYAAKSTEDKHGSIPSQLEDCRAMAEREGWTVVDEYQDEGFSAYSGNRGPGLASAREKAAEVAPSVLLVLHSDRLARGAGDTPGAAEHLAEIVFWARRNGVHLRSVQDDDSLTNPLLAFVMGERNMEDSRRKSAAVKSGMKRRAGRGKTNGGPRPYGYRWAGPKGEKRLVPNPGEAVIVRRMFEEFLAGRSQQTITRTLNAEGVRTVNGGEWYQGTLARVLRNPVYKGCLQLNGEVYEGEHEAIVDAETWTQVAELRDALARTKGGGRGRPPRAGHLFTKGMLRCGECGDAMIPTTKPTKTPGRLYEVYECFGRKRKGVDHCSQVPVPRAVIDGAAFAHFRKWHLDVEGTRERLAANIAEQVANTRALREAAEREAQEVAASLSRIRSDYKAGKLEAADWQEFRDELGAEQRAAEAKAERLRSREREIAEGTARDAESETFGYVADLQEAVMGQVQDAKGVEAVRAALMRLFESFTYEREGKAHRITFALRESIVAAALGMKIPLHKAENNEAVGFTR